MVRNKGRGSGILRTPDVLRRMMEVGCEAMGPGKFSVKTRLGVTRTDELLKLIPMINEFPLRFLTVHARTAEQMYEGKCDLEMMCEVAKQCKVPLVLNGDIPLPDTQQPNSPNTSSLMISRPFLFRTSPKSSSSIRPRVSYQEERASSTEGRPCVRFISTPGAGSAA